MVADAARPTKRASVGADAGGRSTDGAQSPGPADEP